MLEHSQLILFAEKKGGMQSKWSAVSPNIQNWDNPKEEHITILLIPKDKSVPLYMN